MISNTTGRLSATIRTHQKHKIESTKVLVGRRRRRHTARRERARDESLMKVRIGTLVGLYKCFVVLNETHTATVVAAVNRWSGTFVNTTRTMVRTQPQNTFDPQHLAACF